MRSPPSNDWGFGGNFPSLQTPEKEAGSRRESTIDEDAHNLSGSTTPNLRINAGSAVTPHQEAGVGPRDEWLDTVAYDAARAHSRRKLQSNCSVLDLSHSVRAGVDVGWFNRELWCRTCF